MDRAWGPLTVDRFATPLNAHLMRFNSRVACPGAEAVDALLQSGRQGQQLSPAGLWRPPFALAATVLRKVFLEQATAVVILPVCRAQPWWPRAVSRATAAVLLPAAALCFTRGRYATPAIPPSWKMTAFYFRRRGNPPTLYDGVPLRSVPSWPPSARQVLALAQPPAC